MSIALRGSPVICLENDPSLKAGVDVNVQAICPPGTDRGRSCFGRAPAVRKRHTAEGGTSRDAWNQIHRDDLSGRSIWLMDAEEESWFHAGGYSHAEPG